MGAAFLLIIEDVMNFIKMINLQYNELRKGNLTKLRRYSSTERLKGVVVENSFCAHLVISSTNKRQTFHT